MDALYEESLGYLREAYDVLQDYHPLDEFTLIFEANNPDVKDQIAKNDEAATKSTNALKKAIGAIGQLIKNIVNAIASFVELLFASKDKKQAYRDFIKAVKDDPALKGKKVTYIDYKMIMKEYDDAIADAEKVDLALAQGKQVDAEKSIKRLTELISGTSKGVATSVGVEFLENIAASDEGTARAISLALMADRKILDGIEKSIGTKNAREFAKDINALAGSRLSIRRLIVKLRQKKYRTMEDATNDLLNDCKKTFSSRWHILGSVISPRGSLKRVTGNKEIRQIIKGSDEESKIIRDTVTGVGKASRSAKLHGTADAVLDNITRPISNAVYNSEQNYRDKRKEKIKSNSANFFGLNKKKKQ